MLLFFFQYIDVRVCVMCVYIIYSYLCIYVYRTFKYVFPYGSINLLMFWIYLLKKCKFYMCLCKLFAFSNACSKSKSKCPISCPCGCACGLLVSMRGIEKKWRTHGNAHHFDGVNHFQLILDQVWKYVVSMEKYNVVYVWMYDVAVYFAHAKNMNKSQVKWCSQL